MLRLIPMRHRVFVLRFARVALPLAAEMFLQNLVVFADTIMVGQLGESSVAGVYVAGRVHFFLFIVTFGLVSGSTISFGQYWGKKDFSSFRKTMGFSLLCVLFVSLIFTVTAKIFAGEVLGIFSRDAMVLSEGLGYLHILAFGYTLQALTFVLFAVLRVAARPAVPLVIASVGLVCNLGLDALLIFGLWIFPAMGVKGAAVATLISFAVQAALAVIYTLKLRALRASLRDFFCWSASFVKGYIKVTYPVVLNELGWSLGMLVYDFVLGVLGKTAQASFSVAEGIYRVTTVLFIGSVVASTVVFSTMLGAGRFRKVKEYAKKLLVLSAVLGVAFTVAMISLAWSIPALYHFEAETRRMLTGMIIALGLYFPLQVVNLHIMVGILRAGADTFFAMLAELATLWLIGVPTVLYTGLVLQWPAPLVMLAAGLEELVKCVVGIRRFRSYRWVRQISH